MDATLQVAEELVIGDVIDCRSDAAATLIDGEVAVVISTSSIIEVFHALRTDYRARNPDLGRALITLPSKHNVNLADADAGAVVAGIERTLGYSERRIPDAILAAAAEQAGCTWIATFDESFVSPSVPSRLI